MVPRILRYECLNMLEYFLLFKKRKEKGKRINKDYLYQFMSFSFAICSIRSTLLVERIELRRLITNKTRCVIFFYQPTECFLL